MNRRAHAASASDVNGGALSAAGRAAHGTIRSAYVPHIDGMRALAVLAVILYHLEETWMPGGFAGVDIFFVISGFVVSASVAHWDRGGIGSFLGYFYARRMQRIAPALVVCLVLTSLFSILLIPSAWLSNSNENTGLYAFFGVSNFFLAFNRDNYFAPTADFNPYTHTWSLGVEEQFYLLFPLLYFTWTRTRRWRDLSLFLFGSALVVSLTWAWWMGRDDPAAAFYLIFTRFWELAAGVLLFQCLQRTQWAIDAPPRGPTLLSTLGAWSSLTLLGIGLLAATPTSFPFPGALVPVVGTLGLLGFLHGRDHRGLLQRTLQSGLAVAIGRASYSLYLWHWPVFVIMRWTCGLESVSTRLAALTLTIALAFASWRFVELPLRYAPSLRRWPRAAVIAVGVLAITSGWGLAKQMSGMRPTLSLSTVARHPDDWYPHAMHADAVRPGCVLGVHVGSVGPGFVTMFSRTGCAPPPRVPVSLFVIGDSHAMAYTTLLTAYVLQTGAQVFLYGNGGCPFVSLQPRRETGACGASAAAARSHILAMAAPGDVLFLPSLRVARMSNQYAPVEAARAWVSMTGATAMAARRAAEGPATGLLAKFAAKGMRILFEAPKPVFRAPPFRCADWFDAGNPICRPGLTASRADFERFRQPVLDSFARIAARVPEVAVWDPLAALCPTDTCSTALEGRPLYFDGDHLSAFGNLILLPGFSRAIAGLSQYPGH